MTERPAAEDLTMYLARTGARVTVPLGIICATRGVEWRGEQCINSFAAADGEDAQLIDVWRAKKTSCRMNGLRAASTYAVRSKDCS